MEEDAGSELYLNALKEESALKIQALLKRFLVRLSIVRAINQRYEKIFDPKRKKYFYYDTHNDKSSWRKPLLLLCGDIARISPTYTEEQAAIMIQSQRRRLAALRTVRFKFKTIISIIKDPDSLADYYYNERTGRTYWELPTFMNGRLGHDTKRIIDANGDENDKNDSSSEEESDSDSELSESDSVILQRRRDNRKYPRSKIQRLVDVLEDNHRTLKELDIGGINATRITTRIYDMIYLETLILSKNKLSSLYPDIRYLINLQVLDVSFNELVTLPDELEELVNLRILLANNNQIKSFGGTVYKLSALEELDLSHNPLHIIPIEVGNLELLKELKVWEVGIGVLKGLQIFAADAALLEEWPPQLELLIGLESLSLSHNSIDFLPSLLGSHKKLGHLDLSHNQLATVPMEMYSLALKSLHLSHNKIKELPPTITAGRHRIESLLELDLSHNNLDGTLENLLLLTTKLKRLRLSHNRLSAFSAESLVNLTFVDLSHNILSTFPLVEQCGGLTHLDVSYNNLHEVSSIVGHCVALKHLDLSHNILSVFSNAAMPPLGELRHCDISFNELTDFPHGLFTKKKLVYLNFSNNRITSVGMNIAELESLSAVHGSDNMIKELPSSISKLLTVKEMNFAGNQISTIPDSITTLPLLSKVAFQRNNLSSDAKVVLMRLQNVASFNFAWNKDLSMNFVDWMEIDQNFKVFESSLMIPLDTLRRKLYSAWDALAGHMAGETYYSPAKYSPAEVARMFADKGASDAKAADLKKNLLAVLKHLPPPSVDNKTKKKGDTRIENEKVKDGKKNKSKSTLSNVMMSEAASVDEGQDFSVLISLLQWQEALMDHFDSLMIANKNDSDNAERGEGNGGDCGDKVSEGVVAGLSKWLWKRKSDEGDRSVNDARKIMHHSSKTKNVEIASAEEVSRLQDRGLLALERSRTRLHFIALCHSYDQLNFLEEHSEDGCDRDNSDGGDRAAGHGHGNDKSMAGAKKKVGIFDMIKNKIAGHGALGMLQPPVIEYEAVIPYAEVFERLDLGQHQQHQIDAFLDLAREIAALGLLSHASDRLKNAMRQQSEINDSEVGEQRDVFGEKKLLLNASMMPHFVHFPWLGADLPINGKLCELAFDCYTGLASALLHRAHKICLGIRYIEIAAKHSLTSFTSRMNPQEASGNSTSPGNINRGSSPALEDGSERDGVSRFLSRLNIAQREGDDLDDLVADWMDSEGLLRQHNVSLSSGEQSSTTSAKKTASSVHAFDVLVFSTSYQASKCINFLQEMRLNLLVFALLALDSAGEFASMQGWDPGSPFFKRSSAALFKDTVGATQGLGDLSGDKSRSTATPVTCVDPGAEGLISRVSQYFYIRARVLQGLNRLDLAVKEFRAVRTLAPVFRKGRIELAKTLLAKGDFSAGYEVVAGLIKSGDKRIDSLGLRNARDVYVWDRELGMLLAYACLHLHDLDKHEVGSPIQKRVFNVHADGLLTCPPFILSDELLYGRSLDFTHQSAKMAVKQKKKVEEIDTKASAEELLNKKKRCAFYYSALVDEAKGMIASARAMMQNTEY